MAGEKKYKWASPHEWLDWHIDHLDRRELASDFKQLAHTVDADTIQDIFEPDMAEDGYFKEVKDQEDEEDEDDDPDDS